MYWHVRRSNIWLALASALLIANVSAAVPTTFEARLDAIYLELGRGDIDDAAAHAAQLLKQATSKERHRAFQAQLDVLTQRTELNKPPGEALRVALLPYVAADPGTQAVATRLTIMQAMDRNDASAALQLARDEETRAASAPDEQRELQALVARVAAVVPGQMPLVREQAELGVASWQAVHTVQATWHMLELDYLIANVFEATGSQQDALTQLEKALKLAVDAFGTDSVQRFKIDADRAGVLGNVGRRREAMEIRESLVDAAKQRYGERSFQAAKAEGLLGASLQEIGDYPAARIHYEHAQELVAALTDAPPFDRGLITANYANVLQEMGDEKGALEKYAIALQLWGDFETTMHARAIVSANMGNTEFRLQNYPAAIADFERALALREKSDGKDSPGLAYALEGLGSSSLALKHYDAAEQYYRRALALRSKAVTPTHPTIAPLQFGVALARWGQGDEAEAFALAVQTAELEQGMLATFAADFSERQSVAYRELLVPATAMAVTLAARRGDTESIATAWRLAMTERGLVARTEAHRLAAARARSDPELAKVFDAWRDANSKLGEAWMSKGISAERMAQLRTDTENAERALWRHTAQRDASVAPAALSISDLAHALPADTLLIAYTEGVAADPGRLLNAGEKPTPEDWYAFALGADAKPSLYRLGDAEALAAQARAWYLDLRNPDSDLAKLRREGEPLREVLLDPLLAGTHVHRLMIVPEGDLYRLSFAALPARDHGYLLDTGIRVHTLANEADLTLPTTTLRAPTTLLAGAPDFPHAAAAAPGAARQVCLRAARDGFAAIPHAGRELDDLQSLLSTSSTKSQITLIRGAQATKQNVLAALPQANIVHLATHGFSLDDSCAETANSRGVILDSAPAAQDAGAAREATLSGLAFTGASVVEGQNPIGVLSAGELATLDLSHLAWIALSACDSGLGPIGRNEGVFGMRRALRLAGAGTVVMSLWQVDDAATADLMEVLYRKRFVDHDDVPDAMAAAMRSVIGSRRRAGLSDHPYYWAAFISEGSWR
jgi:CHAT domain-containing protein/tetratricopeptide (TPR) repeat protein